MPESKSADITRRHNEYLFPCTANYYQQPIAIDHAKGTHVWDVDGNEYLDFFGGILTIQVGHCNDRVVQRMIEQVQRLQHTSTLYPNENIVDLAEKLAQITPGDLKVSFFTNSGTEANETAIQLARLATGHQEIISLRHSYHGRSNLALSVTGNAHYRQPGAQDPSIKHAINAYCYRCPLHLEYPGCGVACADDLEEVIETSTSGQIAAVIAEPIQGVGGFITPPREYFAKLRDIAHRHGGLLIIDEVQTGFGRTGGTWFGIEHWDVEPDIMTMAKGMANGTPIGATIAREEIARHYNGASISTFGGNPVSTAAALATIEEIEERGLLAKVKQTGSYLRDGLEQLAKRYPMIGEVRGLGLMQGVEVVHTDRSPAPDLVDALFEETKSRGLLIGRGGLANNTLRVTPPLVVEQAEIDRALSILDKAFGAVQSSQPQTA